ncbi:DUF6632 domain-containing protein [Sphingomonas hankyongi]|uniref:DUF4345 domain-containing protein n=1 Tax=Sphingomonas hankyongi TaxID=2908209 RepID=A0ABT0S2I9_9SPHN|nr:DUF6632 domain-containing protein [Sphingomonas hankyongi]MCL6729770.1 hypothetical protein [Sphingomonas hankyongi]
MSKTNPLLSVALIVFGALYCLLYPMLLIWPSGWAWHHGSPAANDYFMMICFVYITLGIFMIRAAKDPSAHSSLIWFVIWSSLAHAAVMGWESFRTPMMIGHLIGDVPALVIIAGVLAVLMKREPARRPAIA